MIAHSLYINCERKILLKVYAASLTFYVVIIAIAYSRMTSSFCIPFMSKLTTYVFLNRAILSYECNLNLWSFFKICIFIYNINIFPLYFYNINLEICNKITHIASCKCVEKNELHLHIREFSCIHFAASVFIPVT